MEKKDATDALNARAREYVAKMQGPSSRLNFDEVNTDRLLILEALNDWSGNRLGEGVMFNSPLVAMTLASQRPMSWRI